MLFDHLIDPEFTEVADAEPGELVGAMMHTTDFLSDSDFQPAPKPRDRDAARQAFGSLLSPTATPDEMRKHALALKTPEAVKHLVGMLSAYDWDFVEQAKELRGFVVAKLLEETKHPDARIRLRSLELIGKVTEVAAFTERSEVIHKNEDASAVEERLRAKLKSLLPPVQEVQDTEVREIAVVKHTSPKD